jgi:exodeoxyribonuclease VII small subunit
MSAEAEVPAAQLGYAEALAELEEINEELDGDEVDVDVLGARVRRAAELLRLCRERIAGARYEVEQVVAELEAEVEAATATAAAAAAAAADPAGRADPAEQDDQEDPDER